MFKLYIPFAQLTPAQQKDALHFYARIPENELRYKRVFRVVNDICVRSVPIADYVDEFALDCPECKGELSLCECYDTINETMITESGGRVRRAKYDDVVDRLNAAHNAHCRGRNLDPNRTTNGCERCC